MTVTTTLDRQYFPADGANKNFPFNFKFFNNSQIYVSLISPDGTVTPKSITTDYTLSGATAIGGGTVVMNDAPPLTVPPTRVFIQRIIPQTQPTSIRNQGRFFPEIHEDAFDRLTMLSQQAEATANNALQKSQSGLYWDFLNLPGKNAADPTDQQDVATKNSVELYVGSILQTGQGPANIAANVLYVAPNGVTGTVQDMSGPGGSKLIGHNDETAYDALHRSGEASVFANGGVIQNSRDYSENGVEMLPALSGFAKVNFDAAGNHAAGTVGTLTASTLTPGLDFSLYVATIVVQNNAAGRLNIKFDAAPIIGDQPNGYPMSTAPIKFVGAENNRDIDGNTYTFIYGTSGSTFTTVTVETDTTWSGRVFSVSVVKLAETMFSQAGAATGNGPKNPVGFKTGAYGRNDVALGDRFTFAAFKYDGLPKTPAHNLAVGAKALASCQHGDENTAVGTFALEYNETSNNTGCGYSALKMNTKGRELTSIGYKSLTNNTTGSANTAAGFWALGQSTTGTDNSALGWYSLRNLLLGSFNTAIGSNSGMMASSGSGNTYLGAYAGYGAGAGYASYSNTTAVGRESLAAGDNTVAIGFQARCGSLSTASDFSVALGASANATGANPCVAVGFSSVASGTNSVAVGPSSSASSPNTVAVGVSAAAKAQFVTAVGAQAGSGSTGINNTFVGALTGSAPSAFSGCTLLGASATVTGDNQVQLGAFGTVPYAFSALQIRSDERDKTDITPLENTWDFIRRHKGLAIQYRYDLRSQYEDGKPDGTKAGKALHAGFPAQKIDKVAEESGIKFTGVSYQGDTGGEDVWSMAYEQYVPYLVENQAAMIEKIEAQDSEIESLKKALHELTKKVMGV